MAALLHCHRPFRIHGRSARHRAPPGDAEDLRALFATRPRDAWLHVLEAADTQVAPVPTPAQALAHPHAEARGMHITLPVGDRQVDQIGTPFHLSDMPAPQHRPAPLAGADTDAILAELGIDRAQIDPEAFGTERSR